MHSIRRATLRAACSASRAMAVSRQQVAPLAVQLSKQSLRPATSMLLSRPFSQTAHVAEEAAETSAGAAAEPAAKGFVAYIGNISYDATETHLHEAFSKYGEVVSITIPRDARGLSRGFGFINFADQSALEAAVEGANQSFWHGRRILVQPREEGTKNRPARQPRENSAPTKFLYIGNIPYETSDADLNALFNSLPGITAVRVAIDRNTGWPRGFAHADFESVEAAEAAKQKIENHTMGARQLRADFSERATNDGRRSDQESGNGRGAVRTF